MDLLMININDISLLCLTIYRAKSQATSMKVCHSPSLVSRMYQVMWAGGRLPQLWHAMSTRVPTTSSTPRLSRDTELGGTENSLKSAAFLVPTLGGITTLYS